jgi:hypothetical protein
MINGAAFWDDRSRYYTQTNNSVERMLQRYDARASVVTCGPSASVNCLAAIGADVESISPGRYRPQPEDVLALWFHDYRNWPTLAKIRSATDPAKSVYSPHEVPQYYPAAIKSVFDVDARFQWGRGFDDVIDDVETGHPVMVNLKPGSIGHFVSIVAYDDQADELIYHDSWPEGIPGHNGFAVRLNRDDFQNTEPYKIVFGEAE